MTDRSTWRNIASPIIARVLRETAGADEKAIRTALFAAYPFGARENHPYKIWCDEIRRQRNLKTCRFQKRQPDPAQKGMEL